MTATVIPIGEPVNEAERRAIAHLRDRLPKNYLLVHNFELRSGDRVFEVDLAVIAPHAVYLVDIKGTRGLIDVYGPKWYPEGRQPFTSPLMKLRGHAKSLKGIITESQRGRRDLEDIFVDAAVVLAAPDAVIQDPGGRDGPWVTSLAKSAAYFQNAARVPGRFSKNIQSLHSMVLKAIQGVAKPRRGPLVFGNWEVEERLGSTDAFTEYRAHNALIGPRGGQVLLRAYQADPYLPDAERDAQRHRIANAYKALNSMPPHAHILAVRDFFSTEHEDQLILVTEDFPGQALRVHIDKPPLALTLDEKLRVAQELLAALAHCHSHEVVHRNLTTATVLLGKDGHLRLTGFDFARAGTDRSRTIAEAIIDDVDPKYSAPETFREPQNASPASDVFAAGLVLYELFTGQRPFDGPTEVFDQGAVFSVQPSKHRSELSADLDDWLQQLCTFTPDDRPSASEAFAALSELLAPEMHLSADEFVEAVLARSGGELRPLLTLLGNDETSWLEFKEALLPPPGREGANKYDGMWAVTKAIVALANSSGGAVLLGVNDEGHPHPLSASDPKRYLEKQGWDTFTRRVLDGAFYRPKGWSTAKKGTWNLDVEALKRCVVTRRATLDGNLVVAVVVRPAGEPLPARNSRDDGDVLLVRRKGDVGVVDRLGLEDNWRAWWRSRTLRSPIFAEYLDRLESAEDSVPPAPEPEPEPEPKADYRRLPAQFPLTRKYVVQRRLGQGAFGVVYKVVDTLGDYTRAIKLILRDRHSPLERLKQEYRTLLRVPDHPNVVRVVDADTLPGDGPPYIVFEFVEGDDVNVLIEQERFAPEDALELLRQVAAGLDHLHRHGFYHCDIKPSNLIWTRDGAKIIDFNVSVRGEGEHGGGSRKYLPPDFEPTTVPSGADLADRDVYALGITTYQALTRRYPWNTTTPPLEPARDPREWPNLKDLAPELAELLLRLIAPRRADRLGSADELIQALEGVEQVWRPKMETDSSSTWLVPALADGGTIPPNTNPFVRHLLTQYSQSEVTNAGTRGLDALGRETYVTTLLDDDLAPAVLGGEFKLVVITGNAGDGKTAFLQQLEDKAFDQQAVFADPLPNGRSFSLGGRTYTTNYDGSQDEQDVANDDVLRDFFQPFEGDDPSSWPSDQVRLVAINEGRLVDFLTSERERFPALKALIDRGLQTGRDEHGVAVVNLNLRSVVTDPRGGDASILERLVRRMTHEKFWSPCGACNLRDRCYAYHNAQTFQDEVAGPQVIDRLKTVFTLTHLRGRLHITLRDLRSALAFMLVGTRDCGGIHRLYAEGRRDDIARAFYFNAWMGGGLPNGDRLLKLLADVDVGQAADPRLDRKLDFVGPDRDRSLFSFGRRANYDRNVLRSLFDNLPRDFSGKPTEHRAKAHQSYVAMARRRAFFERRDEGWRSMLPYRSAEEMLRLVRGDLEPNLIRASVLGAINRGEGLTDPERLEGAVALQVRHVDGGTIRSYRLFPADRFSLVVRDEASRARFVEHMPDTLELRFQGDHDNDAVLPINLDVLEMLTRLNAGYRPSLEEQQGYYLSLAVFKNVLSSAPYQEVLLTRTGHDFFRVERHEDGRLELNRLSMEVR
jgi:serine/threonine protein kinase